MIKVTLKIILLYIMFINSDYNYAQSIRINEVLPSNDELILDEDGDDPDWIELLNTSDANQDLSGYFISDTKDNLEKWQFPPMILQPDEYLLLFASGKNRYNLTLHWETIIDKGESWKYLLPVSEPAAEWNSTEYNDTNWNEGETGIGYGDNDDKTVIPETISLFARKTFTIDDTSKIGKILFHIDYDDGFIAYMNGVEFARSNLGSAGSIVNYNQPAEDPKEAKIYEGGEPEKFEFNKALLKEGENVIAVQVHNVSSSSSDLTFIPFLTLGMSTQLVDSKGLSEHLTLQPISSHTNFKIKSDGDDIFISKDNVIIDSLVYPSLRANVSFGRVYGFTDSLVYFPEPTPGEENSGLSYPSVSPDVNFDQPSGIYPNSITLNLTSGSGAEIYYTTDGSEPSKESLKYISPLELTKPVVIKAKSFVDDYLPGTTTVNSFLIGVTHDLPVFSLSTEPNNLWDYNSGIYVKGPNASNGFPFFGANFWQDWEKPAHIEFFELSGKREFTSGCGIKIYGAYSRAHDQKSLAVFFRGEYGNTVLKYQLFPGLPFDQYESFVLRNSGNDWKYTMLRDGMNQNIIKNTDVDYLVYRPAVLYLNGEYWGIHNIREKVNEDYLARRHGIDPDRVDIIEEEKTVVEGSAEDYLELKSYMESHSLSDPDNYDYVKERIDINEFINYFLLNIYIVNTDWPENNIKCWKSWEEGSKWRWFLYDTDKSFGLWNRNEYEYNMMKRVTTTLSNSLPRWSIFLLRKLLVSEEFKNKFIDHAADLSNTYFLPQYVAALIDSISGIIKNEIPKHSEKWNQFSVNEWNDEVEYLYKFAEKRLPYFRSHISDIFKLDGTKLIEIKNGNPSHGRIKLNSIIIDEEYWSGYYFKGREVKLTALSMPGYKFSHWIGDINSDNPQIIINPNAVSAVEAIFEAADNDINAIVINEINYNSSDLFNTEDWIELYNTSNYEVDISGWNFRDSDTTHSYILPQGTSIAPNDYLVICENSELFSLMYIDVKNIIGDFKFGLSGEGETVYLYNNNISVDSVAYDDEEPWTVNADGNGHSLELIDPYRDNNLPNNWGTSSGFGSPGKINSLFTTSVNKSTDLLPVTTKLLNNYPNPFNSVTTIVFQIAEAAKVELKIYDIQGREIEKLFNGNLQPGLYNLTFDSIKLSSGVYFYKLETKKFKQIKKMLLLK